MSVRPTGATASTRPLGPLTFSRAPAPREVGAATGGAAAEVSLSELARATVAPPGAPYVEALAAAGLTPAREARAEMARALATLSEPVRSFASFTQSELARGAALLRGRVLRGAFSAVRDVHRPQMNDLTHGLSALARTARGASSLESDSLAQEQTESSWRAFTLLTRSDRTLLSLLYVSAQTQGGDLTVVDDVVRALLTVRQREQGLSAPSSPRAPSAAGLAAPRVPDVSALAAGTELEPSPHGAPEREHLSSPPQRSVADATTSPSFGSAFGLAARAVNSYRSLLPPPATLTSMPPRSTVDDVPIAPQNQAHDAAVAAALARPFSAAQALGVSPLIDSLTRNLQTARRPHYKPSRRTESDSLTSTAERDGGREARRRARWHELFRRRRALRSARLDR